VIMVSTLFMYSVTYRDVVNDEMTVKCLELSIAYDSHVELTAYNVMKAKNR